MSVKKRGRGVELPVHSYFGTCIYVLPEKFEGLVMEVSMVMRVEEFFADDRYERAMI
jgi:hypothetical protein